MSEIIKPLQKDERYLALIEDIVTTVAAKRDERKLSLIEENYIIGRAMIDFVEKNQYRATDVVKEVAGDLGQSERNVWTTYQIVKEQPDIEKFFVAYRSWSDGKVKLLGTPEGEVKHDFNKIADNLIGKYGLENAKVVAGLILAQ